MAKFTDKNEIKLFEKDEQEHQSLDEEEELEEHHAHFQSKEKWKRPKPPVNRQPTRCVKLGQQYWSDEDDEDEEDQKGREFENFKLFIFFLVLDDLSLSNCSE